MSIVGGTTLSTFGVWNFLDILMSAAMSAGIFGLGGAFPGFLGTAGYSLYASMVAYTQPGWYTYIASLSSFSSLSGGENNGRFGNLEVVN